MKKCIINIIETIVIIIISFICIVSILQSTVFGNKAILGYRTYTVASNSMYPVLKYGDVILVKEILFEDIKIGDIITYMGTTGEFKDKIITHEVVDIEDKDGEVTLKMKGRANTGYDPLVHSNQIYGKLHYKFIFISMLSKLMKDDIGFIFIVLIPVGALIYLEINNLIKETKRKKLEKLLEIKLEEVINFNSQSKDIKELEKTLCIQIEEIKEAKGKLKNIKELENTVMINLENIEQEITKAKKKKKKKNKNFDQDKTMVLFSTDDIKKEIEKELKLKNKKLKNKSKNI